MTLHDIIKFFKDFGFSTGFSIVSLSSSIFFILLPIHFYIDRWKRKNSKKISSMNSEIDKIKKYYTSRKRAYQISAIHKRYDHNLSQILKSSFGIFIQIPIFLLIYKTLRRNPYFIGQNFGPFADLNKADAIIDGINLFPFLMLAFNLMPFLFINELEYRKKFKSSVGIGALFFFITYKYPSAMLICWTTSNFLNAILQIFLYRHDLSFKILNDIGEKIKFRLSLVNKKDWILSANILILSTIYSGVISPYKTFSWYFSNLLLLINLPCHLNLIFKQSFLQKVVTSLFCLLSFGLFIDLPQHLFIFKTLSILSALYSLFIIFQGFTKSFKSQKRFKKRSSLTIWINHLTNYSGLRIL